MDDRATAYANWLVSNQDKAGTPEFQTVAAAYKQLRMAAPDAAQPQAAPENATQPTEGGFAPRDVREAEPTRDQNKAAYSEMAKGVRERQGPVAATIDTVGRGLARAVPVMDDIAAAGEYFLRGKGASYQDALDRQRAMNEEDDTNRPVASYGSQVAGALALPVGAAAQATTLPARIAAGAKTGAAYGAAYGFGSGDDLADRANKAGSGLLLGGALGGAAPAVVEGAGKLIGKAVAPFRGALSPESEASRRIAAALARDEKIGQTGLSRAEFDAAKGAGQPAVLADMGGETTRALARQAANVSPEGRAALETTVGDRFEGQGDRITNMIEGLFGNATFTRMKDKLAGRAKVENNATYGAARQAAEGVNLWDNELARISQAPDVMDAIREVSKRGQNKAVIEGAAPIRNPFKMAQDGTLKMRSRVRADGTVEPVSPNLSFWQAVKEKLDDKINGLMRAGEKNAAGDTIALKNAITDRIDSLVPEYKTARAGAHAFFGAEDALTSGRNFVRMTDSIKMGDAMKALGKMKPAERALFAQGFASELTHAIKDSTESRNVLNQMFLNNENARQRITLAMGPKRARELEVFLRREKIMDALRPAVKGNSTTARQLLEAGVVGGGYGLATGDFSPQNILTAAFAGHLLRRGGQKMDQRVSRKVGEMLASDDPQVLQKAIQHVAGNTTLMHMMRKAEDKLSRALATTADSAPGLRLLPSAQNAVADERQQDVPGPRR